MIDKEEIFDNISSYTADQIVGFIKQGIVTVLELEDSENTSGQYSLEMRNKVNAILSSNEPNDWQRALDADTVDAYQYYLDTYPDGEHREEARSRKKEVAGHVSIPKQEPEIDDEWEALDKNSIAALDLFITNHPGHPMLFEAERLKVKLENEWGVLDFMDVDIAAMVKKIKNIQADKKVLNQDDAIYKMIVDGLNHLHGWAISREDLVQELDKDKNLLNATVVHKLYDEGYLSMNDFRNIGIDREFVQYMLEDIPPQRFGQPAPLTQVSRTSTEIYFWGIPSSGKSCALGGILSVANNGKIVSFMDKDSQCQGYGYMSRLMLHFKSDGSVGTLPEGTATTATYEMGFNLTDHNGMVHPITCVDLAGELIRCMFKFDSGEALSEDELTTLDTLTNILVENRTGNQKMHFFVIEYGADDRLYEGLPQRTYLEAAVQYINNFEIFRRDTDAIFILVSKIDKAPAHLSPGEAAVQYLNDNYSGFINSLKAICRRNEINGGNLEVMPFSLGIVCFQNYCRFKEAAAEEVVRKILERSKGFKEDKLNKLKDRLKR